MKEYLVRPVPGEPNAFFGAERIDAFPWGGSYRPDAEFSLAYGEDAIFLALRAREKAQNLRAAARGIARDVWHDSCLECFLMPMPASDRRYVNFEFNPAGAMFLGIGTERSDRVFLGNEDIAPFRIAPFAEDMGGGDTLWGVTARLPLAFFERFFPGLAFAPGTGMLANFYKCGEKTPAPHYACWSSVEAPAPDFHRPECFAPLIFV